MASSKSMDNSVREPLNIQVEKLNVDLKSLMEAFRNLSAKVSTNPLASDLVKRNLQGALNSNPGGFTSTTVQKKNLSNQVSKTPVFDWRKCFVVESVNTSLNRDVVRIGICQKYGPTEIKLINEYKLHGERADRIKSRCIVQTHDDMKRKQIVESWPSSLLEGSSARDTIQRPMDTVIVPNVPLEFQEEDNLADINIDYRAVSKD